MAWVNERSTSLDIYGPDGYIIFAIFDHLQQWKVAILKLAKERKFTKSGHAGYIKFSFNCKLIYLKQCFMLIFHDQSVRP